MGLPENTGVWTNPFLGNRRLLVDFSIFVLAWHPILARASTSGPFYSIHFWLRLPASKFGTASILGILCQHPLLAAHTVLS